MFSKNFIPNLTKLSAEYLVNKFLTQLFVSLLIFMAQDINCFTHWANKGIYSRWWGAITEDFGYLDKILWSVKNLITGLINIGIPYEPLLTISVSLLFNLLSASVD